MSLVSCLLSLAIPGVCTDQYYSTIYTMQCHCCVQTWYICVNVSRSHKKVFPPLFLWVGQWSMVCVFVT